ncbi:hypothetical protein B4N89_44340 [Embleya scabrispora]|uniref:Uncharacterized protein n=1 Tax=Embleya scabrispora TaxID=159449 RepID=A0A1T3NKX1_9ACTN|nr:hypothetical protein [Embleya scabrispora]OPC77523.1 hypothetical protein B4N89_44340 [Embleya scabrispora]
MLPDGSALWLVSRDQDARRVLGAQLARTQPGIAGPAPLRRFPTLSCAVPPERLRLRASSAVYGVAELPVTW